MYHYYFDFQVGNKRIADELGLRFDTPDEGRAAALIALSEVFVQEIDPEWPAGATVTMRDDHHVVYVAAVTLIEKWVARMTIVTTHRRVDEEMGFRRALVSGAHRPPSHLGGTTPRREAGRNFRSPAAAAPAPLARAMALRDALGGGVRRARRLSSRQVKGKLIGKGVFSMS